MKIIGNLGVTEAEYPLLIRGWQQDAHDFTTGYEVPARLKEFLDKLGYLPSTKSGEMGLLFSSCGNVDFHNDDARLTALWVLAAPYTDDRYRPHLICSGKVEELILGNVYLFNATKSHAVLAGSRTMYLLYCFDVKRKKGVKVEQS